MSHSSNAQYQWSLKFCTNQWRHPVTRLEYLMFLNLQDIWMLWHSASETKKKPNKTVIIKSKIEKSNSKFKYMHTGSIGLFSRFSTFSDDKFWKILSENCAILQLAKCSVFNLCAWTIGIPDWTAFWLPDKINVASAEAFVNSVPCNGFSAFTDKSMWCKLGNFANACKINAI